MKKITKYIPLFFCICFILSCHLQPPKSVVVRTKAEYNFSLGEISQDLSEHFSVDEILKELTQGYMDKEGNFYLSDGTKLTDGFVNSLKLDDYHKNILKIITT